MASMFFSRAALKQGASVRALAPLLLGKTGRGGSTRHTGHHLVWSLFADSAARRRDFLWREIGPGSFFILSERKPQDQLGLFDIAEPKAFEPDLAPGDLLTFSLRANPVIRRRSTPDSKPVKHDVVMNAIYDDSVGDRARQRSSAIRKHGVSWLSRQGIKAGFSIEPEMVRVDGYEQHRVSRRRAKSAMAFSTLDFEGVLRVVDPVSFLAAVAKGFGSAKAYGCGLMLIRRA